MMARQNTGALLKSCLMVSETRLTTDNKPITEHQSRLMARLLTINGTRSLTNETGREMMEYTCTYQTVVTRTQHSIKMHPNGSAKALKDALSNIPDGAKFVDYEEEVDSNSMTIYFEIEQREPPKEEV